MARAAHTCTRLGGSTKSSSQGNWVSLAVITLKSPRVATCRAWGRWPSSSATRAEVRAHNLSATLSGRGEMIPNSDCFCQLDPTVKDRWGIPVLRFHWKWSEHELRQADHMQRTFADIIDSMDGRTHGAVQTDGASAIA